MIKDIILISAYCPDIKRQTLLLNLVNSIPNDKFDILITSHTTIPQDIQNKVNYVFYDQENPLYHDMESSPYYWERLKNDSGYVYHTKLYNPIHLLAILRLKRFGYQIAKMLGYKKLHCLEYDALVTDPEIFKYNGTLLNSYSAVIYNNEKLPKNSIHGSFKSINLDQISWELLDYNESKIKYHLKSSNRIIPEQYAFDLFNKLNVILQPSKNFRHSIQPGLYSSSSPKFFEIIPFFKNQSLYLYYFNNSSKEFISFNLQLNDSVEKITINPLAWFYRCLGEYKDISYIKTTIQSKPYFELDFSKDNNREIFKKRHFQTQKLL